MSGIELFQNDDFQVRSMLIDGEPWFVAADICRALSIANTSDALGRIDDDCKGVVSTETPGGVQQARTVNEAGMYLLVMRSDKAEAVKFRKWIASEVLPAIRKTCTYSLAPAPQPVAATPYELIVMLGQQGIEIDRRVTAAEAQIAENRQREAETRAMVEQVTAKVDRRHPNDASLKPITPSTIGARLIPPVSGIRANEMLQECGFQWKQNGQWTPSHEGRPYAVPDPGIAESGRRYEQLKWQERIIPVLERRLARRAALGKAVGQ